MNHLRTAAVTTLALCATLLSSPHPSLGAETPTLTAAHLRGWEDVPLPVTGRARPHQQVRIVTSSDGGTTWNLRTRVVADDEGRFTARLTLAVPRTLLVRGVTDSGATAPSRMVVRDRALHVTFGRDRIIAGVGTSAVRGRLTGPRRDRVRVWVARPTGRWRSLGWRRPGADGRFRLTFRSARPGRYRVRAVAPGPHRPASLERTRTVADRINVTYAFWSRRTRRVTARDLGASWRPGCPVGPRGLDELTVTYRSFARPLTVRTGTLVVRDAAVPRIRAAFRRAFRTRFPIRRIAPASEFGGDDFQMMSADVTSAFNCRQTSGGSGVSPHSYGWAVDINTRENPYHAANGRWYPRNGWPYIDRSNHRRGMLFATTPVTRAFTNRGYQWGGVWSHRDYQHFDLRYGVARTHGYDTYRRGPSQGD